MRYDDAIFPYKGTYDDMGEYDVYYTSVFTDLHVDDEHIVMTKEEPYVTQSYPYFLSALAITLGRLLHISTVWTFFMGRFVNLLFFVAFYAYAIKKIPVAKLGLFGMGLLAILSQQSFNIALISVSTCSPGQGSRDGIFRPCCMKLLLVREDFSS